MGRKLHLGSGGLILPGFESVDIREDVNPDHVAHVSNLPFLDGEADVIYFCHGLEHIPIHAVEMTLAEWRRVLKSGGKLYLSVPDFEIFTRLYHNHEWALEEMQFALMGGQDYRQNFHYSLWDHTLLSKKLFAAGFRNIHRYNPKNFLPKGFIDWSNRRMRGWQISLNMTCNCP